MFRSVGCCIYFFRCLLYPCFEEKLHDTSTDVNWNGSHFLQRCLHLRFRGAHVLGNSTAYQRVFFFVVFMSVRIGRCLHGFLVLILWDGEAGGGGREGRGVLDIMRSRTRDRKGEGGWG